MFLNLVYKNLFAIIFILFISWTFIVPCFRGACKNDFFVGDFEFEKLKWFSKDQGYKMKLTGKKSSFLTFSDTGCLIETKNIVQFLYACKISCPKDKSNKRLDQTFFLPKISKCFLSIFA